MRFLVLIIACVCTIDKISYSMDHSSSFINSIDMFVAFINRDSDTIRTYIQQADDALLAVTDDTGWSLLHYAAKFGLFGILALLLERNLDVAIKDDDGEIALHCAASEGNINCVKLLLAYNADVNSRNFIGVTPLHYAVTNGHKNVVELLLAYGAAIEIEARYSGTPLELVVKSTALLADQKKRVEIAKLLLEKGACYKPFYISQGHKGAVVTLLESYHDLLVQAKAAPSISVLQTARAHKWPAPIQQLLRSSLYINRKELLAEALEHGWVDIVRRLLQDRLTLDESTIREHIQKARHNYSITDDRAYKKIAQLLIIYSMLTSSICLASRGPIARHGLMQVLRKYGITQDLSTAIAQFLV